MDIDMTPAAWLAETQRRIAIDEGCRLSRYPDSNGIPTLGIGYNLTRGDAPSLLPSLGINYASVMAGACITQEQADRLFAVCFAPIMGAASTSLAPGMFRALSDARRFAVCDLEYNLGEEGWIAFTTTRTLLSEAQAAKSAGKPDSAHSLFAIAADHLSASAWASQTGDRARRNIAMIRNGAWVDATGSGTA